MGLRLSVQIPHQLRATWAKPEHLGLVKNQKKENAISLSSLLRQLKDTPGLE